MRISRSAALLEILKTATFVAMWRKIFGWRFVVGYKSIQSNRVRNLFIDTFNGSLKRRSNFYFKTQKAINGKRR